MDDKEIPACPDCGNPLEYAVQLASVEHNHLRPLRCSRCGHPYSPHGPPRSGRHPTADPARQ